MLPPMLLLGLAIGRWWTIPLAAAVWAVLVICTGSVGAGDLVLASVLGATNAAIGLAVRLATVGSPRVLGRLMRLMRAT